MLDRCPASLLVVMLVSPLLFAAQGCVALLASLATAGPQATAAAAGARVATGLTRNLFDAGARSVGEAVAAQTDTVSALDRILADHPNAANRPQLERLRNEAEQRRSADPVSAKQADPSIQLDRSRPAGARLRDGDRDRRLMSGSEPQMLPMLSAPDSVVIAGNQEDRGTRSSLRRERPLPSTARWRALDPEYHGVLHTTALSSPPRQPDIFELTGLGTRAARIEKPDDSVNP